jgi:hypothetical protein
MGAGLAIIPIMERVRIDAKIEEPDERGVA